jgi:hypothetical protein
MTGSALRELAARVEFVLDRPKFNRAAQRRFHELVARLEQGLRGPGAAACR